MKSRPKLLVIEENEGQLSFLEDFGYSVDFLSRTNKLFEVLESLTPRLDLILLNLSFSYVTTSKLLEFLRKQKTTATTPIMVVSDLKDKKDELFALRSGADDFITLPFDVDILLARIDGSLRRANWNKSTTLNISSLPFLNMPMVQPELTVRETTILKLVAKGSSNDEIALMLCLSTLTVKTHVKNLFKKLGVGNRTEAILVGINFGLIENH